MDGGRSTDGNAEAARKSFGAGMVGFWRKLRAFHDGTGFAVHGRAAGSPGVGYVPHGVHRLH